MNYKIVKLDRRHSWHHDFAYMIEFPKRSFSLGSSGVLAFDRSRRWFNETFGWSQDVDTRERMRVADKNIVGTDEYNSKWSWSIKYDEYRLYVSTEAELNWFVLKHPQA